jgi:uncharacterized membrane protein HdeD (DUF308 family)
MNKLLESFFMVLLGALLVAYSEAMTAWLVMICGGAFVLAGGLSLLGWMVQRKEARVAPLYPLVGVGSALFGLMLLIFPNSFITALMYLLAVVLLVAGTVQCYSFWDMRRKGVSVHAACYIVPLLTLGVGLYILTAPTLTASLPFILMGAACILHGLMDLITVILVWRRNRQLKKEEARVVVTEVEQLP